MHRACFVLAAVCGFALTADAFAQSGSYRYPRVYGPTGRPYGPTQAEYQYQRQYGRPWHGYGGATASGYSGSHFNIYVPPVSSYASPYYYGAYSPYYGFGGYGGSAYGYAPYAYGLFGTPGSFGYLGTPGVPYPTGYVYTAPSYNYAPFVPPLYQAFPRADTPFENEVLANTLRENDERWNQPLDLAPNAPAVQPPVERSLPEEQMRSMQNQAAGDTWFRKQNYSLAYNRYRAAVAAADDRPEPRFRAAFSLTAMGQFGLAIEEFKKGLRLDPTWPQWGEKLSAIFGEESVIAKDSVIHKVADWTRADIRDPDRLFLLGVLVYFDGNTDQAATLFETALRLAGGGEHLKAFLRPPVAEQNPSGDATGTRLPPANGTPQKGNGVPDREILPSGPKTPPAGRKPGVAVPPLPAPPDDDADGATSPTPAPRRSVSPPSDPVPAPPDENSTTGPALPEPVAVR